MSSLFQAAQLHGGPGRCWAILGVWGKSPSLVQEDLLGSDSGKNPGGKDEGRGGLERGSLSWSSRAQRLKSGGNSSFSPLPTPLSFLCRLSILTSELT